MGCTYYFLIFTFACIRITQHVSYCTHPPLQAFVYMSVTVLTLHTGKPRERSGFKNSLLMTYIASVYTPVRAVSGVGAAFFAAVLLFLRLHISKRHLKCNRMCWFGLSCIGGPGGGSSGQNAGPGNCGGGSANGKGGTQSSGLCHRTRPCYVRVHLLLRVHTACPSPVIHMCVHLSYDCCLKPRVETNHLVR